MKLKPLNWIRVKPDWEQQFVQEKLWLADVWSVEDSGESPEESDVTSLHVTC